MRFLNAAYDLLDRFALGRLILRGVAAVALVWLALTGRFFDDGR